MTITTESFSGTAAPASHGNQSTSLKLWVVLSRAYAAVEQEAVAHVARHGLTIGEFGVLEALYHKGPMLLGEVQRKILCSSGGVTYLVDRLEEQGLVERRACPADRRARYATLTRKGRALVGRVFPEHAGRITQLLSALNPKEQRQAHRLMRKLGRAVAAAGKAMG